MSFAVLNPGGRDKFQNFSNGPGDPFAGGHPPINYHAYAASLRGSFHQSISTVSAESVLLLLRKRNMRKVLATIAQLRARGCSIFVSLKESGSHQIAETLGDVSRWELFREICSSADGAISSTPEIVGLYSAAGAPKSIFLPTPYPVDFPKWNFTRSLNSRRGIFVGTREFGVPSRNHLEAVALADQISRDLSIPMAVMNSEGRNGGMILKTFQRRNPLFYIIEAPLSYKDYLQVMLLHRIVWQLDSSAVPGQVAGDSLLCGMPCVGGNGAVERLVFPDYSLPRGRSELVAAAKLLLEDDQAWKNCVDESKSISLEKLSYSAVAIELKKFTSRLPAI